MARQLTCIEMVELVTDYLDGALPWRARRRFERHLRGCPDCPKYVEQIGVTARLAGVEAAAEQVAGFESLRAAFRDWQADSGP
jgi:anti-sigma factor RsiW